MRKLAMENETFSSKNLEEILTKFPNKKECLNAVSGRIKETTGTSIYFCKIIGSRWSFYAGDITLDIPEHRFKISDNYGIMTGKIGIPDSQWTKTLDLLKKFL